MLNLCSASVEMAAWVIFNLGPSIKIASKVTGTGVAPVISCTTITGRATDMTGAESINAGANQPDDSGGHHDSFQNAAGRELRRI